MKISAFILAGLMALVTVSCTNVDLNKGKQGAIGGAAGGALLGQAIGRNTEATLIGAAQSPCRQAEIIAVIDGKTEKTYTTACRNDVGQWVLQN
jgi:hypothetical protein